MNKSKIVSILFVLLGIVVMIGSIYVIMSYATDMLQAIVDFVTTNDFTKLQQCGVNAPTQFSKIKADFVTIIMPFMYVGLPLIMITLSALMFLGGFYYHKAKDEEETKKTSELKRQMVQKIVKKMSASQPSEPSAPEETEAAEEDEPATEEAPEEEEEPEEEEPKPKARKKK